MKVGVVRVRRLPLWPPWAALIVLVWLLLGAIAVYLSFYLNRPVQLCLIKNLSGVPCPTCGFTRGILCLLEGRIFQAWLHNPLLFSGLSLYCVFIACRMAFARSLSLSLTKAERRYIWAAAAVLFVVNWVWIVFRDMKPGMLCW